MFRPIRYVAPVGRPEVICLCGSTKFGKEFQKATFDLTLQGKIVLSVGCMTQSDDQRIDLKRSDKAMLDVLHFAKIDASDYVHVLNVDGYIGESTEREIIYSLMRQKPVTFLKSGSAVADLPDWLMVALLDSGVPAQPYLPSDPKDYLGCR